MSRESDKITKAKIERRAIHRIIDVYRKIVNRHYYAKHYNNGNNNIILYRV